MCIDNLLDFDLDKLREYVEKYKFVDILRMKNISKSDMKKLNKLVENVNQEFGSSIKIIQKRKLKFISYYALNDKASILDITNLDDDNMSKEYIAYKKNKMYIKTIFDRMNMDMSCFYKTDLGLMYLNN